MVEGEGEIEKWGEREREREGERERERGFCLSLRNWPAFLKLKTATSSSGGKVFLQAATSHIGEKAQGRAAVYRETSAH